MAKKLSKKQAELLDYLRYGKTVTTGGIALIEYLADIGD